MDDKEFGLRVRNLRERAEITREDFCGDEIELSIRQLSRIETGSSKPTFSKISFIADRLGMTLYELMPDYVELDSNYLHLKYQILRTPTYGNRQLIQQRDEWLDQIYENFYEELPEEEQIVIDTLRSIFDILETDNNDYGKEIVDDYFYQISQKKKWGINDLVVIRLFVERTKVSELAANACEYAILKTLIERLPKEVDNSDSDSAFVLRDLLFGMTRLLLAENYYSELPAFIQAIEQLMTYSQDFQKKPILHLVKWKYELFVTGNRGEAENHFNDSIALATLLGQHHLVEKLQMEWKTDIRKD